MFITNKIENALEVYRYATTKYVEGDKPYLSLTTRLVEVHNQHSDRNLLQILKFDLINKYNEPANVPAYFIDCDYPFPFLESIFPKVAIRFTIKNFPPAFIYNCQKN